MLKKIFHSGDYFPKKDFGRYGEGVAVPEDFAISNPKNIFLGNYVKIGEHAVLFATNAKIIIKQYFVSADGLKIATGQHERRLGRFLGSIAETEKNHNLGLDKDVIINEDVWAGFNVCIMAGVEVGRGCTIAAGSVVTRSLPPYSICAGVPARFIKFYWTVEEIIEHEKVLYSAEERFEKDELLNLFAEYSNGGAQ